MRLNLSRMNEENRPLIYGLLPRPDMRHPGRKYAVSLTAVNISHLGFRSSGKAGEVQETVNSDILADGENRVSYVDVKHYRLAAIRKGSRYPIHPRRPPIFGR